MLHTDSPYSGRNLSCFRPNLKLPRHRWYEFKEGFASALVQEAISAVSNKRKITVLDPFCGSGTTLLTAALAGHQSVGIEVNPFLAFAAQAKCTPGSPRGPFLKSRIEEIINLSRHEVNSPLEGQSTFTERPDAANWLFNRSVLRGFTALNKNIAIIRGFRDPFRLALLSAVMDCCNARRDGKCLRYRRDWRLLGLSSEDLKRAFRRRALEVIEDLHEAPVVHRPSVIEADCRLALKGLPSKEYDLVVTSPPYLNSSDYSDIYRPELFVGGFVSSNIGLRELRLRTIRSHVQVKWQAVQTICSQLLRPILDKIETQELWDPRIPAMVISYFHDLCEVLTGLKKKVKRRGLVWLVIGTSAYGGVEIPVDLILADIAVNSGWQLLSIHVLRQLRSAGQQWPKLRTEYAFPLRESLIMLRA